MDQSLVKLWAGIGSEAYSEDFRSHRPTTFVPFEERWPQPGFVGPRYLRSSRRILVVGQNLRARTMQRASGADKELFRLIRNHSRLRTVEIIDMLFEMQRKFMQGIECKPAWRPITAARNHLCLRVDAIAYLNLIPLATFGDHIAPEFKEAFGRAIGKQLQLLNPKKMIAYRKGAYDMFRELGSFQWDVRYIEQRNYKDAPAVQAWLGS